jgi:uncharacterized protein YukE
MQRNSTWINGWDGRQLKRFSQTTNSLTEVSDTLLSSYKSITDHSDGINHNSRGYVHQMEALNRNISGLNTIYEIQLKSISSQIDTIERINGGLSRIKDLYEGSVVDSSVFRAENERMAQQLAQLNTVYSRLLQAMTVNMPGAGMFQSQPQGDKVTIHHLHPPTNPRELLLMVQIRTTRKIIIKLQSEYATIIK